MTNEELAIVREYKAAKQPLKQIGLLADLHECSKDEIVRILREAGCELPKQYSRIVKREEAIKNNDLPIYEIAIGAIDMICANWKPETLDESLRDKIEGVLCMVRALEEWQCAE